MIITFLIRSLNYGGSERQLVALAKGLHERGLRVLVTTFYSGGPLEKELREAGVPLRMLNKRGRWDVFGFLLRLIRLVRQENPDILHGYLKVPNILTVTLKPLFPQVRIIWGLRASNVDLEQYDWFVRLTYQVERRLSRFADLIVVNSHAGAEHAILHGFPKNKMTVISNGIDTERFCPNPEARRQTRAEWGVTEGEKLIGLVGRLDPMKDHPTFLRAAAMLLQERDDVRFVCVGDGPASYRRELRALGKELGLGQHLIWAGVRVDMPAVYNTLDIATSSSLGEGFPNVVGEAMACGVACVVTDVGDSAWIIGETGMVVPPKEPERLAAGWARTIDRLGKDRDSIADGSRRRVVEEFGLEKLTEKTFETLSRLL